MDEVFWGYGYTARIKHFPAEDDQRSIINLAQKGKHISDPLNSEQYG